MPQYFLCHDSEESLFEELEQSGLIDPVSQKGRDTARLRIDILGTLFERTGLVLVDDSGARHPHFRPLSGYWAMISGPLSDQEKQKLTLTEGPAELIRFSF